MTQLDELLRLAENSWSQARTLLVACWRGGKLPALITGCPNDVEETIARWIATHKEDLSPEEVKRRAMALHGTA